MASREPDHDHVLHSNHSRSDETRAASRASQKQNFISAFLTSSFPDPFTRAIFILIFLLAIAGSAVWLSWIISTRWREQELHPTIVFSVEQLAKVPLFQGIVLIFPPDTFDVPSILNPPRLDLPPNTRGHIILPMSFSLDETRTDIADTMICGPVDIRNSTYSCQPGQNGTSLYGKDRNSPLPDITNPNVWPHQVNLYTQLCIDVYSFVDIEPVLQSQNLHTMPFFAPAMYSILVQPISNVKFNARNHTTMMPRDEFSQLIDEPVPLMLQYQFQHIHTYAVTKRVTVEDDTILTYKIDARDSRALTPEQLNGTLSWLYQARPDVIPQVEEWLSEPNVRMFPVRWCMSPSSLGAVVTTEKNLYGLAAFISDLGGFLNLLAVALAILFPLANRVSDQPRRFVLFILLSKLGVNTPGEEEAKQQRQANRDAQLPSPAELKQIESTNGVPEPSPHDQSQL